MAAVEIISVRWHEIHRPLRPSGCERGSGDSRGSGRGETAGKIRDDPAGGDVPGSSEVTSQDEKY